MATRTSVATLQIVHGRDAIGVFRHLHDVQVFVRDRTEEYQRNDVFLICLFIGDIVAGEHAVAHTGKTHTY